MKTIIRFKLRWLTPTNTQLLLLIIVLVLSILIGGAPEGGDLPGN